MRVGPTVAGSRVPSTSGVALDGQLLVARQTRDCCDSTCLIPVSIATDRMRAPYIPPLAILHISRTPPHCFCLLCKLSPTPCKPCYATLYILYQSATYLTYHTRCLRSRVSRSPCRNDLPQSSSVRLRLLGHPSSTKTLMRRSRKPSPTRLSPRLLQPSLLRHQRRHPTGTRPHGLLSCAAALASTISFVTGPESPSSWSVAALTAVRKMATARPHPRARQSRPERANQNSRAHSSALTRTYLISRCWKAWNDHTTLFFVLQRKRQAVASWTRSSLARKNRLL